MACIIIINSNSKLNELVIKSFDLSKIYFLNDDKLQLISFHIHHAVINISVGACLNFALVFSRFQSKVVFFPSYFFSQQAKGLDLFVNNMTRVVRMKSLRLMSHVVTVILVNSYHKLVNCQQIFFVDLLL